MTKKSIFQQPSNSLWVFFLIYVMVAIDLSMIPSNLLCICSKLYTYSVQHIALCTHHHHHYHRYTLRCRYGLCMRSYFEWIRVIGILWKVRRFSRIWWWSVSDDTSMALLPLPLPLVLLLLFSLPHHEMCMYALYIPYIIVIINAKETVKKLIQLWNRRRVKHTHTHIQIHARTVNSNSVSKFICAIISSSLLVGLFAFYMGNRCAQ